MGDVELLTSEAALAEFERVLGYSHLPFTSEERERFPELLRREARVVEPDTSVRAVDDDPDDDVFLQCAVAGGADCVASGDPHLADLGTVRGIPIYTPDGFLSHLEAGQRDR